MIKNKIMDLLFHILLSLIIFLLVGLIISQFICCGSFEPIRIEGETDECNAMYTAWAFSLKLQEFTKKGKSSGEGIATILTKECIDSWKRKRKSNLEEKCKNKYYSKNEDITSAGKDRYILYLKCLSDKD